MSHEERSEALIEVLNDLEQSDIPFVLVGGYAISQFETRFSTDLDLVIAPEDYEELVDFLEDHNFERTDELDVPPEETIYNREIELFERTEGLVHPVGVDVLVNGLGCRQTEAEWSFGYLREHSTETTVSGGSKSTIARAAEVERETGTEFETGSMARPVCLTWDDHTWSESPRSPERASPNEERTDRSTGDGKLASVGTV